MDQYFTLLNEKDILEVPETARKGMEFVLVSRMEDALKRTIPTLKDGKSTDQGNRLHPG